MNDSPATRNLKYLEDIKKYNETHEKDFKQVFFKPSAENIKSSPVGVFIKDIYGNESVNPAYNVPGYHTKDSCELNTALYANSVIDYNSPINYKPGVKKVIVAGDFANSPNYFLTASSTTDPSNVSVEITGFIAAQKPGNYTVAERAFPQNVLVWVGNNAVKTYRKENALFVVENGVKVKNQGFPMVVGEYTPFRIQASGNIDHQNLWFNRDNYPISVFAVNANENNLYYYALAPSDKTNYYTCNVYKGSDLEKYKSNATEQINLVWQKEIPEDTESIFMDMLGNLCTYDSNYVKNGDPIFKTNATRANRNKLELYQRNMQPLCFKDANDVVVPLITIPDLNTVSNQEWQKAENPMVKVMTNREEQVGEKRISIDRITEKNPLYSENFRYKLCIMRNQQNKKILALLSSSRDGRQFYTAEPDLKMNKLFYASTYIENKFLREVPAELKSGGSTYITYSDTYPLNPSSYTETAYSANNNCEKQCSANPECNHVYNVSIGSEQKCLMSSEPVKTYLPRQPDSVYTSSKLKVRNPVIRTGDAEKDAIYNKTQYVENGYKVNSGFADYPVERKVLSKTDTPGPEGTSYVVELRNNIQRTTNGTAPFSITNINSPMIAGKIENFTWAKENFTTAKENFTTVVDDSLTKLDSIDAKMKSYSVAQTAINKNRVDISNNIDSINKTYLDMSGNQRKYDFTGSTIYALEEDRSLAAALLKDNAIYEEEQNNLFVVTTLTMATLLVASILVSK